MSFLGGTDHERNVRVGVFMFFFIFFYSLGKQSPETWIGVSVRLVCETVLEMCLTKLQRCSCCVFSLCSDSSLLTSSRTRTR